MPLEPYGQTMMNRRTKRLLPRQAQRVLVVVAVCLVAGCASVRSKFATSRRPNLSVFSDQTAALLGDADASVADLPLIRLRGMLTPGEPEEMRLRDVTTRGRAGRGFLIELSISLSRIPIDEEEEQQIAYLVEVVDQLIVKLASSGTIAMPDAVDNARAAIAAEETLLGAAAAAAPVLQEILERGRELSNEMDSAVDALVTKLEGRIDTQHADSLRRAHDYTVKRQGALEAVELVWQARAGNEEAVGLVPQNQAVRMCGGVRPGDSGYDDLLLRMRDRVEWIERVKDEIREDLMDYHADHAELDKVHAEIQRRINANRIELIVWLIGYGRMTAGIVEPAAWFDASSAGGLLSTVGRKAL